MMDLTGWMECWDMFPAPGGLMLCAVSGGRDSMCLLHYLHGLSARRGFRVAAAHLNHGMRPTALRDEELVRTFCEERGIPLSVGHARVYEQAEEWGLTVEEAGRKARYDFLTDTARALGAEKIATAHHQNDQAETVLLHLLRGTGPEGLGGIPPVRGAIVRPLLDTPREEIEAYVAAHGIPYQEDETNADTHYARNCLRREIWPMLEGINPQAGRHVAAAARILRRENEYLDGEAERYLPPEGTQVERQVLLAAPEVLRPRMLRLLIDRLPCGKKDFGRMHLEALERLAASGGVLDLPEGVQAAAEGAYLRLTLRSEAPEETALRPGETVRWGGYEIRLCAPEESGALPLRCLGAPLSVRPWRSGDGLYLPGGRGKRSVKRLLSDAGFGPAERGSVPVLCAGGRAIALWGVGADREFAAEVRDADVAVMWKKI